MIPLPDATSPGGLHFDGFNFSSVLEVCRSMREWDRREVFGVRDYDRGEDVAVELHNLQPFYILFHVIRRRPTGPAIALFGLKADHPGTSTAFMIGTERFHEIARPLAMWVRRELGPRLLARSTLHRIQCHALAEHREARRFIEFCGGQAEGVHPGYGKGGESYVSYAWTRERLSACA